MFIREKTIFYQKLIKRENIEKIVYKKYVSTLQNLKEWNEVDKYIRKNIKNEPENVMYKVDYGYNLEIQGKANDSKKYLEKLIEESTKDQNKTEELAAYFIKNNQYELAEKTYLSARKNSGNKSLYALQLGNIYRLQNRSLKMLEEYINMAVENKSNMSALQNVLQDNLTKQEDYEKFEQLLISKIQKEPNENVYNELLIWYYIQQKDFYKAFFQARSMDKRLKLEGAKLMEIGMISLQNKDYKSASAIYEYLVKEYPTNPNYPVYRRCLILSKEELVKNSFPVDKNQIQSLVSDYQRLIEL